MSQATIIAIADAVVTKLNGHAFSQTFTAARKYQPTFELAELNTLHVSVAAKASTITTATRGSSFFDLDIDIGVQKRFAADAPAEVDALMWLVEQIIDELRLAKLADAPSALFLEAKNDPIYAPDHYNEKSLFTSVITITYRVQR